jgi:hypothetical protein
VRGARPRPPLSRARGNSTLDASEPDVASPCSSTIADRRRAPRCSSVASSPHYRWRCGAAPRRAGRARREMMARAPATRTRAARGKRETVTQHGVPVAAAAVAVQDPRTTTAKIRASASESMFRTSAPIPPTRIGRRRRCGADVAEVRRRHRWVGLERSRPRPAIKNIATACNFEHVTRN